MRDSVVIDKKVMNRARLARMLTWNGLAQEAGLSPSTIFSIKSGRRLASFTTVRKIAHALNVDPVSLVQE